MTAEKLEIFDNSPEGLCVIDGIRYFLRDGEWIPFWDEERLHRA